MVISSRYLDIFGLFWILLERFRRKEIYHQSPQPSVKTKTSSAVFSRYLRHVEGRLRRVAAPGVLGFVVRAAVSDEWRQVKEVHVLWSSRWSDERSPR